MKQYDITVKIRITAQEALGMTEDQWAHYIAEQYAQHAFYSSIGADEVIRIDVEEV